MKKKKVFALFRNPATYIDPLLQKFSNKTDLYVAISVNKPHEPDSLKGVRHLFLRNSDYRKHPDGIDIGLIQPDVRKYLAKDYDVVFIATSYWSLTTWLAIFEARRRHIPLVTRMTVVVDSGGNILKKIIKKVVVTLYCSKMSAGVYECEEQKKYFLKYGMNEDQLFFAPCAVDNDFFVSQHELYDKVLVRSELGIQENEFIVVFTGQLIKRKRPFDIIRAIKELKDEKCRCKLYMLGSGPLESELKSYIIDNDLSGDIILCGNINHLEMSKYMSAADLYVLPSEYDASPKALNEAMNFNLPIIISDGIQTAREMCEHGINGYVFKTGRVDELKRYIRIIHDDLDMSIKMGLRSKKIVEKYSFDAVVEAWLKAIEYCTDSKEKE